MDRRSLLVLASTLPFAGAIPPQEALSPEDKIDDSSIFYVHRHYLYKAARRTLNTLNFDCWGAFTYKHESGNRLAYAFPHPEGAITLETSFKGEILHDKSREDLLDAFQQILEHKGLLTVLLPEYIVTKKFDPNLLQSIHTSSDSPDFSFSHAYLNKDMWGSKRV